MSLTLIMASPRTKDYFLTDPNFPSRLLNEAGHLRTIDFIQYLYQEFSTRELSKRTDRSVALRGLEQRIAQAVSSTRHHGIINRFLHQTLLWQPVDGISLQTLDYGTDKVPSWSWQSLYGKIEFPFSAADNKEWITDISIESGYSDHVLAEIASFRTCTLQHADSRYEIIGKEEHNVGWIRYDMQDYGSNFEIQSCVQSSQQLVGLV
jgi:hypothetical protein